MRGSIRSRPGAASDAVSPDAPHAGGQFGAQDCKRGVVRAALRPYDDVHRRQCRECVASHDLSQPAAQAVARHGAELEARHDDADAGVVLRVGAPSDVEVCGARAAARFPAGVEIRTARESHAARIPLARSATPVLGGQADGEALAPLLPPAGQDRAPPYPLPSRPESVLIDAAPVARAITRTHKITS